MFLLFLFFNNQGMDHVCVGKIKELVTQIWLVMIIESQIHNNNNKSKIECEWLIHSKETDSASNEFT